MTIGKKTKTLITSGKYAVSKQRIHPSTIVFHDWPQAALDAKKLAA